MIAALRRWSRRARSAAELLAVGFALFAMISATPLGAVLRYSVNRALGHRVKRPSLARFFDSEAARARAAAPMVLAFGRAEGLAPLEPLPAVDGVSPRLVRALRFVARSQGLDLPLETLPELTRALGSPEAAVAALVAGRPAVQAARDEALAMGAAPPVRYEALRAFLPGAARDAADELVAPVFALTIAQGLGWPVEGRARLTSGFGYREHPILKSKRFHTGIDLAVPVGTGLLAAAAGRVVYAGEDSVNGKFLKLDHGFGLTSAYCHASELLVKKGAEVEQGATIAKSGESGRATGPHLHFQLSLGGKPIDPMPFYGERFPVLSAGLVDHEVGADGRGGAALEPHAGEDGAGDGEAHVVHQPELNVEEALVEQVELAQAPVRAAPADGVW